MGKRPPSFTTRTTTPTPSYLYNLPADLQVVQLVAMGAAMDQAYRCVVGACNCHLRRLPGHYRDASLVLLVRDCVHLYSQVEVNGRRGTNNLAEFHSTFAEIVPRVYLDFSDVLASSPNGITCLRSFPDDKSRFAYLNSLAMSQLDLLRLPLDTPLPLRWLLDDGKEVA